MSKYNHPWFPDWRGRRAYWEDIEWRRHVYLPGVDVAVALYRQKCGPDSNGNLGNFENRYYLLFRRLGEDQVYSQPVLAQTIITSSAGSNQTITSDATWNNSSNSVECIGAGASGASSQRLSTTAAVGGGGGCYSKITNFSFATPGTTQATVRVGAGGAAINPTVGATVATSGNDGGATWFNNTTDPGNGADNSKCSGAGGIKGTTGTGSVTGGAGGATTSSWGTTKNAGGRGGSETGASHSAASGSGGGGAGGTTAAGSNGVDSSSTSGNQTAGGAGGTASGGTGGSASGTSGTPAGDGGTGTVFDATHGAGGGGGAFATGGNASQSGGAGGLYGGGSGACCAQGSGGGGSTQANVKKGGDGIVVLTWNPITTPSAGTLSLATGTPQPLLVSISTATTLSLTGVVPIITVAGAGTIIPSVGTLSLTGTSPALYAWLILLPDGDNSTGAWLNELNNLPLWPSIDEMVRSDSDYIQSSPGPSTDLASLSMSNPTDVVDRPFTVLYRYRKQGAAANRIDLTVRLKQGGTTIATWTHTDISTSIVEAAQVLTSGQFSSITNFTNLFVEFEANAP